MDLPFLVVVVNPRDQLRYQSILCRKEATQYFRIFYLYFIFAKVAPRCRWLGGERKTGQSLLVCDEW